MADHVCLSTVRRLSFYADDTQHASSAAFIHINADAGVHVYMIVCLLLNSFLCNKVPFSSSVCFFPSQCFRSLPHLSSFPSSLTSPVSNPRVSFSVYIVFVLPSLSLSPSASGRLAAMFSGVSSCVLPICMFGFWFCNFSFYLTLAFLPHSV